VTLLILFGGVGGISFYLKKVETNRMQFLVDLGHANKTATLRRTVVRGAGADDVGALDAPDAPLPADRTGIIVVDNPTTEGSTVYAIPMENKDASYMYQVPVTRNPAYNYPPPDAPQDTTYAEPDAEQQQQQQQPRVPPATNADGVDPDVGGGHAVGVRGDGGGGAVRAAFPPLLPPDSDDDDDSDGADAQGDIDYHDNADMFLHSEGAYMHVEGGAYPHSADGVAVNTAAYASLA
jgi:hypothetical protein